MTGILAFVVLMAFVKLVDLALEDWFDLKEGKRRFL